jgi:hypothetical protein
MTTMASSAARKSPTRANALIPAAQGRTVPGVPSVVLSYSQGGADRLAVLLSEHPDVACTSGAGLLPLCEQAAAGWQKVEGRGGALSSLAATSIRSMTSGMMSTLVARSGKRHWCELTTANPTTVAVFLQLFPEARIACLHRSCTGFIRATLNTHPWGLSGAMFAPFVSAYPASTVTALASCWVVHTRALIQLETARPGATHRIRYEDLTASPDSAVSEFLTFIGLDPSRHHAAGPWQPARSDPGSPGQPSPSQGADPGQDAEFPADELPPPLRSQVNELLTALAYPALE